MATIAVAKIGALLKVDGKEFEVYEGDIVNNLVYTDKGQENTITGKVRVICASTRQQNADPDTCPPDPYVKKYVDVTRLIIDNSEENVAKLTRINIANVVGLGSVTIEDEADGSIVVGPGSQYKQLDAVLADAPEGTTVKLAAGEYEMPLTVNKSVSIVGNAPGVVLKGKIDISKASTPVAMAAADDAPAAGGIKVEISNVRLTGDATIKIGEGVDEFVMTGCAFGGHNLTEKTMPIHICTKDTQVPMLIKIEDNIFEAENQFSYNLMEIYAKLKSGSSISNNKFMDACCTHNQISLYGIDDGATVKIDYNYAYYSANMIRLGFIGTPVGTVEMNKNYYDATDKDPAWQGLFLVQPFGNKTESFAGLKINVNGTKCPANTQLGYVYAGSKDTPFTDTNMPVVTVDGVVVVVPNASPVPAATPAV